MVNVLIVDDNPMTLKPLQLVLPGDFQEEGIPVDFRIVRTPQEAEEYIQWAEVAVVDGELNSPGRYRDGYAFAQRIKEENPTAYAIVFSGGDRKYTVGEGKFDEFLPREREWQQL